MEADNTGKVEVMFDIDEDGQSSVFEIILSSPTAFEAAVIGSEFARRFVPVMRDGRRVKVVAKCRVGCHPSCSSQSGWLECLAADGFSS